MRILVASVASLALLASAATARAASQDLELWKLGSPREALGDGSPNPMYSPEAQARYEALVTELGLALSSSTSMPAETLGHAGFEFAFEWTMAQVAASRVIGDRYVWPVVDDAPDEWLHMPALHVRKGLPFSWELGARVQYLSQTEMFAATADARWALNEGFAYVPDLAVRGHATRLLGSRYVDITTGGVDVGISKEFSIAGMTTLTPYGGWDLVLINASSNVIDFDPFYEDPNSPTLDDATFDTVFTRQNRFYGGLRFIGAVGTLAGEFSYAGSGEAAVKAITLKAGLVF